MNFFGHYHMNYYIDRFHHLALGNNTANLVRKSAIISAILGFVAHIGVWLLHELGHITISGESSELVKSPLSALYTPFSILLAYEVYQLIRTIPDSFSSSVGKQFEIATLLVVREILKRLSEIEISDDWSIGEDLRILLVECVAFIVLFYTSISYHRISLEIRHENDPPGQVSSFISYKKIIATTMIPVFLLIAAFSFFGWVNDANDGGGGVDRGIFFLEFFTFLILADILILLISYWFYTDFANLARNTGFVLSTVVIRVAISSTGLSSMILFMLSGVLGVAIIGISSRLNDGLEKHDATIQN